MDPLDQQQFGFLDPDPQKYSDPRANVLAKYWKKCKKLKNYLFMKYNKNIQNKEKIFKNLLK